jgi:hypothetical protein
LLAYEAVLDAQEIMRKRFVIKEVPKAAVKIFVFVIADRQQSVFDTKSLAEILSGWVMANFRRPASKVFAIEQRNPVVLRLRFADGRNNSEKGSG